MYWSLVGALLGASFGSGARQEMLLAGLGISCGLLGSWLTLGRGRSTLWARPAALVLLLLLIASDFRIRGSESPEAKALGAPARIIVIGIDTLRPDHLSSYGYERQTTPNLDRVVAEEGVLFERVYSSSSWTLPSMASVFTSLHPIQHRVVDRGFRLAPQIPTLAGVLAQNGWLTAAFVTHIYVSSLFGLDSGFLEFRELSIDWNFGEGLQVTAEALNEQLFPWLEHHADQRFFLYVHIFDPHWDYSPPEPFASEFIKEGYSGPADGTYKFLEQYLPRDRLMSQEDLDQVVALYDGEIKWTDHQLGRLFDHLKRLGLWEDTLLVVLADHGEEFQEHQSFHHIRTLYEEVLRVPLLVKLPGGRSVGARLRVPERVRNLDLAPTILDLAGIECPSTFQGESILPLVWNEGADRTVFAHTVRHESNKMTWIEGEEKLIFTYTPGSEKIEYFDLSTDPGELSANSGDPSRVHELHQSLIERAMQMMSVAPAKGEAPPQTDLTPEQEERLRALGYID